MHFSVRRSTHAGEGIIYISRQPRQQIRNKWEANSHRLSQLSCTVTWGEKRIDVLSSSSPKIEKYFNIYSPPWCVKPVPVFTFIKNEKRCFQKCPGCSFPYDEKVNGDGIRLNWHYIVALCEVYLQLLVIPFVSPASHIASNLLISP